MLVPVYDIKNCGPRHRFSANGKLVHNSDSVNLQNLPRGSALKNAMEAPEGYVFIDCDSSQIEARTLAWLAGQDDLVDFFRKNNAEIAAGVKKKDMQYDPYKIMASEIYGVPVMDVTDDQRFVGKTTILGCFGPDTKVLTSAGWKRIVEVQATDTLWDGEEWVSHKGVIPQGVKEVLTAQGLTATLDHEILTGHGWREWSEVATNPSLFQSAIDRASSKLLVGSSIQNQPGDLLAGTPWCGVHAGGKGVWTAPISKQDALLGATSALKALHLLLGKSIGGMRLSSQTLSTGNDCLTVLLVASGDATTPMLNLTQTTEGAVLSCIPRGAPNGVSFSGTLYLFPDGTTQSGTSTALTTTGGMSRVTFASSLGQSTTPTAEKSAFCKQKSMTYDIAYAGPRNRYTVATDAGPIIVHNCGYGMGANKFQIQLRNFGVALSLDECIEIIQIYRATYPKITELWRKANTALEALMSQRTSPLGEHGALTVDLLGIRLPNGLYIRYPDLHKRKDAKGNVETVYGTKKGKNTLYTRIYGGKVVENVCQALARIIIGEQMLAINRNKRVEVVMTVHDAVGSLVKADYAVEGRKFIEDCMRIPPKWATGLPLNCESKMGASYGGK